MSIHKQILRLAIPNILSNISVPLLSSVDTALMGRETEAALYIGAVGLGAMFFNMVYWSFSFLRMGTTGMTAQAFGQQDRTEITAILGRGILVAIGIASLLLILQYPLKQLSIYAMAAQEDTAPLIQSYFSVRIWAAPASLCLMVLMGWYFGMQNSIFPLILTLTINITNLIFSIWWVQYEGMGIQGVAWGTVVAQYIGLFCAILLLRYKYREYTQILAWQSIIRWHNFKRFFFINRDIFLRTICLITVFGFFYNRSSIMGATLLAVNQVFMQYSNWTSFAIDGFAYASESLMGRYEGEQNHRMKSKVVSASMIWAFVFAVLISAIFYFGDTHLLAVFTDNMQVIQTGKTYLIWIVLFPLLGFASYIWDGIFVGLTASRAMRDTMFLSLIAFAITYLATTTWANHGLWFSFLFYLATRGILQTIWYKKIVNTRTPALSE